MTPPLTKKAHIFNCLDRPVDFGKNGWGEPILGSHKTWRGVILGLLVGTLLARFLFFLHQTFNFNFYQTIGFLNYHKTNGFVFGFLISAGAVFGDLFFAFIKRRLKMAPGARFLPFDQTNYVIGAALFLTPFFQINLLAWVTLFCLTFFLHIIFNRIGYWLGLHSAKW